MKKLEPKFVKKANCYCVTEVGGQIAIKGRVKSEQKVNWFSTYQEALNFYNS